MVTESGDGAADPRHLLIIGAGPGVGAAVARRPALRSAATILCADLAADAIRVASVTIAGTVAARTPFSPDRIAEKYWTIIHSTGDWHSEFRIDET